MASDSDLGQRVYSNVDGDDGRVQSKLVGNNTSQSLGADAQSQAIVDAQGNLHIENHGNKPNGDDVVQRMAENGSIVVDGVYHVSDNSDPANIGLVGMVRDVAPADSQQTLRLTAKANADGSVRSLDIALHDAAGEPFTTENPLPVYPADDPGTEIQDQNTKEDLATGATDNHDYEVAAGDTFRFKQVVCTASGDARYEVLIGDGATPTEAFTRKAMQYSTPSKDGTLTWATPIVVTAVATARHIRVIRKNLDNKQQDVHTTIVGVLN